MPAKESIGLVGANGVGKSTLMKLLAGLNMEYEGKIQVGGLPVIKKNLEEIREKIGYVFQDSDSQLFMSRVYDGVAFTPRNYGYPEQEVEILVHKALEQVHIEHLKDKQIYKMSSGEKKLASIAGILALEPGIIIMDEPSIALEPRNRRNLINILNACRPLKLIASHDLAMILDTWRGRFAAYTYSRECASPGGAIYLAIILMVDEICHEYRASRSRKAA